MSKPLPCRAQAARLIAQLMSQQSSLANLIPKYLDSIDEGEHGLFKELCFGVMRHHARLSGLADQLIHKPLKEKDRDVYALVLIGLYQLAYMRVPDHAAIAETVQASIALRKQWAKSFVNGVLRQYQRRADSLQQQLSVAASHSHPAWLYGMINKRWPEQLPQILAANNAAPPMILRVNRQQCRRDDYLQLLAQANIAARPCRFSADGIVLEQGQSVDALPHFADGWLSVQDESAQLAANLLDAQPQHRILDACCAPGGKTCHLLEQVPTATVHGLELVESKLERVRDNLQRLGLEATLFAGDASQPADWHDGQSYHRILLDAPCSATGVIRRNPDVKLMRQPEEIAAIAELQFRIISALWPLLAVGGKLLYATCSIMPAENTHLVERFVTGTTDARHRPIDADWGIEQPYGRQILPGGQDGDGFFYACIEKVEG
ncbi:16S rRNA m(5)C-967 methyltransferase [Sinobacterium caligoides]|uniref:16S rRNA (cytosine(967)-C(5))-methyltransferase n=1 Tax=Sinobacterium caligoides TaxID=933926 RepID=A0A3N2DGR6_9GAMM|nr:16S rRNA (cytosine(967)-C(5))-methyltransferase RsmB [Sinobacterium caligoides]ROR98993.1 16S rRNA m(5)C-967 methyltransferase [Sinobacterium caligoides]